MKIQLPREIRIDMNDTMDDLKQQVEARIDIIDENQRKALEEMKEEEKVQIRQVNCKLEDRERRLRDENTRFLRDQAKKLAEAEGRMHQELTRGVERMEEFKEEITTSAVEHRSGAASTADGGAGIETTAEVAAAMAAAATRAIKTNIVDLRKELDEVIRTGRIQQDTLKDYMKTQDFDEFREEINQDVREFREVKHEWENSRQVLSGVNEDKRIVEQTKHEVKEAMRRIDAVDKKRKEDLLHVNQLDHEVDAFQATKGNCQMLMQKVKDLEGEMSRVDQASRRLTDKAKELENVVPEYKQMKKIWKTRVTQWRLL